MSLCPPTWFRLFKSSNKNPEVYLDLKSKHVSYSYISILLYDLGHILTRNLKDKSIKQLS